MTKEDDDIWPEKKVVRTDNSVVNRYYDSFKVLEKLLPKDKKQVIYLWGIGHDIHGETPFGHPPPLFDLMRHLKNHNVTIHVMDYDPKLVGIAKKYFKDRGRKEDVFFHVLDMSNPQHLPKERPDVVISTNVPMYIKNEKKRVNAVKDMIGALKPGGLYMLDAKDVHSIKWVMNPKHKISTSIYGLSRYYEKTGLSSLGLKEIDKSAGYAWNDYGIIYRKKKRVYKPKKK